MDTDLGDISPFSFRLVLTEPIIGIALLQHTAAMRIDVHAVIVRPDLTGLKHTVPVFFLTPAQGEKQQQGIKNHPFHTRLLSHHRYG